MVTRIILYLFALADLTVFYIFYQEWVSWIVLLAVLGGAGAYVYRAKKAGQKCIGCPHAKACGGSCHCGEK